MVLHKGSCHCGAVTFQVQAPSTIEEWNCNCSICVKKQNKHFVVPAAAFTLLTGEDNLTTYTFNTHAAKHRFCKTCGVQSFYIPRSNPNGVGVMAHCIDSGTILEVVERQFDGRDWEKCIKGSDIVAQSNSKEEE